MAIKPQKDGSVVTPPARNAQTDGLSVTPKHLVICAEVIKAQPTNIRRQSKIALLAIRKPFNRTTKSLRTRQKPYKRAKNGFSVTPPAQNAPFTPAQSYDAPIKPHKKRFAATHRWIWHYANSAPALRLDGFAVTPARLPSHAYRKSPRPPSIPQFPQTPSSMGGLGIWRQTQPLSRPPPYPSQYSPGRLPH